MSSTNSQHELNDNEFELAFSSCQLQESLFTHEAHLRLAWIHIKKYGERQAIINVCRQFQNYVRSVGAEDKYNTTLTVAAIKAVNHFIRRSRTETFKEFIAQFPQLHNHFKELLATHYTVDICNSRRAKEVFVEPDLAPFT